jgi:hypothetical protein
MSERDYNNMFRFTLTQGDVLLCEKMFDADKFNPFTRYSIDIRDILPRAITRLQKTLSKKNYDVNFEVGRSNPEDKFSPEISYDLYQYHKKQINQFPSSMRNELYYNPTSIVQQIEDRGETKTIRGVECKIGLYINDKTIVERVFYVDGFNPVARWSVDLTYVVIEIAEQIENQIKKTDIRNMWDDYDLINQRGLSINQIRELTPFKREELLRKIRYN